MLALGKDGKAYLLNRDNLGGIGGGLATIQVSSDEVRTAPVVYSAPDGGAFVVFAGGGINCPAAISNPSVAALKLQAHTTPAISTAWCASLDGSGAPIVTTTDGRSDAIVWIVGAEGDDRLHAFRGNTGESLLAEPQLRLQGLRHFATIVATQQHMFVPADGKIYAFTP
jgi:hypothetical protein